MDHFSFLENCVFPYQAFLVIFKLFNFGLIREDHFENNNYNDNK